MLRVTFEIVPFGQEDHPNKRVIGTMRLGQLGVDENNCSNYSCELEHDGERFSKIKSPKCTVKGHWRPDGAFDLVRRALEVVCLGEDECG